MKLLVILVFFVSLVFSANMTRLSSTNVVRDFDNSLEWIDNKTNIELLLSHKEAVKYCEELNYGGASNWRIPHIDEFKLIVDKKNERNYINRAFKYNVPSGYWAKTAHFRTFWYYADYMHFISGTEYYDSRHKSKYVRCIRDLK